MTLLRYQKARPCLAAKLPDPILASKRSLARIQSARFKFANDLPSSLETIFD